MEVFTIHEERYIPKLKVNNVYCVAYIQRDLCWIGQSISFTCKPNAIYCGRSNGKLHFVSLLDHYNGGYRITKDIYNWLITRDPDDFSKCDINNDECWLNYVNKTNDDVVIPVFWDREDWEYKLWCVADIDSGKTYPVAYTKAYYLDEHVFDGFDKIYAVRANGSIHTKEYKASDVSVDRYGIHFNDGTTISSDDVGIGKVNICKNIINIHEEESK